jgi:uncharacterized membrane protein
MSSRALPISCVFGLIAVAIVRSISTWDALPDSMASHFGPSGRPDGWQSRAAFFATFGGVGIGTALLLLAIPTLLRHIPPSLINVPHRSYWLVPARIDEARRKLAYYMDWFAVAITLVLVVVLELVLRANVHRTRLDESVMYPLLIGFFAFTIAWLVWLYRGFRPPQDGAR